MRILILDEEPGLAEKLAAGLRPSGFTAVGFTDWWKVLWAIQKKDVLVVDYHLRFTTGLEVARRAYAGGWGGVLVPTTRFPLTITEPLEHPGMGLLLFKPFDASELLEAVGLSLAYSE
jgi:DNA-binding response OmpR family regulator